MGKRKFQRNQGNQDNNNSSSRARPFTDPTTIDNPRFTEYYKGNVVDEKDWDQMITTMRQQLPISFRISNITGRRDQLLAPFNEDCFGLPESPTVETIDDKEYTIQRPTLLPWYRPRGCAFQLPIGKRELKQVPIYRKLREYLMRNDIVGNLTRQESVSMIPPLLLDVQPHHCVLDMCAAPGSKTSQLLEALHIGLAPGEVPPGIVIANDANPERAYMLVHQLKRLGSPSFLVTTHTGQQFPTLFVPKDSTLATTQPGFIEETTGKNPDAYFTSAEAPVIDDPNAPKAVAPLLFDRILCDVPCSGDGTARKTPTTWSQWTFNNGLCLHPLQLQIAWRAAQLLKIDGLMVYSTCSLNPLENEAVVSELIRRGNGSLELVDVHSKLPELISSKGVPEWKDYAELPRYKSLPPRLVEINNLDDIMKLPHAARRRLKPSTFSPGLLAKLIPEAQAYAAKAIEEWKAFVEKYKDGKTVPVFEDEQQKPKQQQEEQTEEQKAPATDDAKPATAAAEGEAAGESSTTAPKTNKPGVNTRQRHRRPAPRFVVDPLIRQLLRMSKYNPVPEVDRTARVLHHHQDTGGFYIALIRKTSALPPLDQHFAPIDPILEKRYDRPRDYLEVQTTTSDATDTTTTDGENTMTDDQTTTEAPPATTTTTTVNDNDDDGDDDDDDISTMVATEPDDNSGQRRRKGGKNQDNLQPKWNEDPFSETSDGFYNFLQRVWGFDAKSRGIKFFSRNDRKIYLLSDHLREVIVTPQNFKLKVVHGGLRVFSHDKFQGSLHNDDMSCIPQDKQALIEKIDPDNYYRITQDGIRYMMPLVTRQVVECTPQDLITVLGQHSSQTVPLQQLSQDFQDRLRNKTTEHPVCSGSVILTTTTDDGAVISCSGMKRGLGIGAMVDKNEKIAFQYLLGVNDNADATEELDGDDVVSLTENSTIDTTSTPAADSTSDAAN